MMAKPKTYDPKCYELAALFLGDEADLHNEENIRRLAREIQMCIEDEIAMMREEFENSKDSDDA